MLPGHILSNAISIKTGVSMSTQSSIGVVDFDDNIAAWLEQYKNAQSKIKEWQEVLEASRAHIEQALGDAETGMYKNQPVVRWTFVETTRFDTKRAKELLPAQVVEALEVVSTSRRFTIVNEDN